MYSIGSGASRPSSSFRRFASRFLVRTVLIKEAASFRILSEVNDVSTNFKGLHVWQLSMDYVTDIYRLTRDFPDYEKYGLGSQLQRSAVSIPSNIAEGSGRQHRKGSFNSSTSREVLFLNRLPNYQLLKGLVILITALLNQLKTSGQRST